jgi:hypothetical protein
MDAAGRGVAGKVSPVVFRAGGAKFRFFANEGNPREPPHIHVSRGGIDAKFWLRPEVTVAYHRGHDERTMRMFSEVIRARREEIERQWNEFFGRAD